MNELINKEILKLQDELSNLDKAVKQIEKAKVLSESLVKSTQSIQNVYSLHLTEIKGLNVEYQRLTKKTGELVEKIDKIDFPQRLDKIDFTISSINQGIQNVQSRLESLERNLKDDLANRTNELLEKIDEQHEKIDTLKLLVQILLAITVLASAGLTFMIKFNL